MTATMSSPPSLQGYPSLQSCPPRWATPRRYDRPTLGPKVAAVANQLGTPFMPWQHYVADVALEVDPTTGLLVYRDVVLTVPRQSGKTTLLLAVMVHRALGFTGPQNITYTAQTRNDARKKWDEDHVTALDASVFKGRYTVRRTNGSEQIRWRNGSRHGLMATTKKSGHGGVIDLGVIDEAFAQVDDRVEQAMKPAMVTRPQPQLWVVSTAGDAESVYLLSNVELGRTRADAGLTDSLCYFEWSATEDVDLDDETTWPSFMPALGHTVRPAAVAADREKMKRPEWERAYGNRWNPNKAERVISAQAWAACGDDRSAPSDPVVFAFDVSPDRSSSAIGVAAPRGDGLYHVEVIDHRPGTSWVAGRLAELKQRWSPREVKADPAGPAGALIADVEAVGVEVSTVNTREHAQACGVFFDGVSDLRLRHRNQPMLEAALDGAARRSVGDAWLWARQTSSTDICPLVAVTIAFGAVLVPSDEGPSVYEEREMVALG